MPLVFPRLASCALVTAAAVALGCGARPLPLSVQAGASVGIALSGEAAAGEAAGYGGNLLASLGRFDDQRGELVFVLRDLATAEEHELGTRIVTRAFPDPASEIGINNRVDAAYPGIGISQILAIVDVPASVPPGTYDVLVRRQRRTDGGGSESLPAIVYGQRLTVLPASVGSAVGTPTPASAYAGAFGLDVSRQLASLVPLPKVVLSLPDAPPHAAHLVIRYPKEKITPRAVFEEQHLGRGSIVAWSDDPETGRVVVDFVDPAASVKALSFAFEPKAPLSAGRIALAEITVESSVLYDEGGAARSGSVVPVAIR